MLSLPVKIVKLFNFPTPSHPPLFLMEHLENTLINAFRTSLTNNQIVAYSL